jgi:hypothetical protein
MKSFWAGDAALKLGSIPLGILEFGVSALAYKDQGKQLEQEWFFDLNGNCLLSLRTSETVSVCKVLLQSGKVAEDEYSIVSLQSKNGSISDYTLADSEKIG